MPKFKRATTAHCARQAKKRKRSQRVDPVRRRVEQLRDTAAHRRIREENPEHRLEEQERDTAGN